MALTVQLGDARIQVTAQPLSPHAFAPFGDVIANPRPGAAPSSLTASLPPNAASANQGSAIQYRDVSRVRSLYAQAPSGSAEPVTSLFVCAARAGPGGRFAVRVLERHPFTTQTFTPVASSASAYLVVVAPSLPPAGHSALPVPRGADLPGSGLPDVRRLRAFVATAAQAVTYAPGTWHAPMVVLGRPGTTLDFVVWQFASGVAVEDCQLVELESAGTGESGLDVLIPGVTRSDKL